MSNYWVVQIKKSWGVKKENANKFSSIHETQQEAINKAKKFIKKSNGGELIITGIDGKIRDKRTISPAIDPYPPIG